MRYLLIVVATLMLSGCGSLVETFNDVMYDYGGYGNQAPTLAGRPSPTPGCSDNRCRTLDAVAAKGYELARQRKIAWVRFVYAFYQKRKELYPNSDDRFGATELISYQMALAEQLDLGKITELQWAYLIDKKNYEINARR